MFLSAIRERPGLALIEIHRFDLMLDMPLFNKNTFQYWNKDYLNRPSEPKLAKRYKNYFVVPKLKPIYPNKTPVPPRESTLNFLKRLNL